MEPTEMEAQRADQEALTASTEVTRRQDPEECLPREIVCKVLSFVGAPDTERLRRLSRGWKTLVDGYCTGRAIRRHFPHHKIPTLEPASEHNLRFRRLLQAQESLNKGYVTKMTKLSQIVDWNLRGDYLLVKYTSGNLTRHTLSFKEPKNLGPLRYFQEDQIFHSKLEATRNPVDLKPGRVALAGQGALIVSGETTEGVKSLARIGSNGRITWIVPASCDTLSVGNKYVYYLKLRRESGRPHHWCGLVTMRIKDGTRKRNIRIQRDMARELLADPDLTTILTGDERFLILKSPGRLVRLIEIRSCNASVPSGVTEGFPCTQIVLKRGSPDFTAYAHLPRKGLPATYEFRYGGDSAGWTSNCMFRISPSTGSLWEPGAVHYEVPHFSGSMPRDDNGVRELGFWFSDKRNQFLNTTNNPDNPEPRELQAIGSSNGPKPLSAPRKDLELPKKDWVGKEDFFGLEGKYLVYYSAREGTLMVFNFQPPW